MMLSNGATLAEVAHQLGHAPGSPMTKRYAKFIPAAQQSIANKAQEAMSSLPVSYTHLTLPTTPYV